MKGRTNAKTRPARPNILALPLISEPTAAAARNGAAAAPRPVPCRRVSRSRPTKTTATPIATSSKWKTRLPLAICMPRSGVSRTAATKAVTAASLTAGPRAGRDVAGVATACACAIASDLLDLGPAEQARGQEDQHHDQDAEGRHILVLDREVAGEEGLHEAQHEAAQHGTRDRADPAQDGRGERLHAGEEADEEVDHAVIEGRHQPGHGGERCPHDEGERNRAVDVDAAQARHLQVLLAGAL